MKWMMSVDVDPKICAHNSISTECDSIWWVWWFGISLVASRVWWFSRYRYSYSNSTITNNTKLRMMIFFRLPISNWRVIHSAHSAYTLWSGPRDFCLNNRDILSYIDRHKLCTEQNAYIIWKSVEISMVWSWHIWILTKCMKCCPAVMVCTAWEYWIDGRTIYALSFWSAWKMD